MITYLLAHGICTIICLIIVFITNKISERKHLCYNIGGMYISAIILPFITIIIIPCVILNMLLEKANSPEELEKINDEFKKVECTGSDWF